MLASAHSWAAVGKGICLGLKRLGHHVQAKSTNGVGDMSDELQPCIIKKNINNAPVTISYSIPSYYSRMPRGIRIGLYNYETTIVPARFIKGMKDATIVTPASSFAKQIFVSNGVPENRLHVIPHGVDVSQYNTSVPGLSSEKDEFVFLYIASPHARKHFDILLDAFCTVFTDKDPVKLIIKSKKPSKKQRHYEVNVLSIIGDCKRRHNNSPKIEFFDKHLPNLASLYRSASVYISPSGTECFGMTLLEAAACGVPIIATKYGGYLDFLNNDNSYLIEAKVGNATKSMQYWHYAANAKISFPRKEHLQFLLKHVYENYEEAKGKAKKALEIVPKYTWEKVAQQYVNLVRELSGESAESREETRAVETKKIIKAQFENPVFYSDFSEHKQWVGSRKIVREGRSRALAAMLSNDGKKWDCINAPVKVKPKTKYIVEINARGMDEKNSIRVNFFINLKQDFKQVTIPLTEGNTWHTYIVEVETGEFKPDQKVYFRIWSPRDLIPNKVMLRIVRITNIERTKENIIVQKIEKEKPETKLIKKGTVSAYTILRNEEENIVGLLNNIYDTFDQIVFLDGGSEDNTVKLIKGYSDPEKKIELHIKPQPGERYGSQWGQPDRRNFCLERCICDWIFMIDADERIDNKTKSRIREIVNSSTGINGFAFPRYNYWRSNEKIRVDGYWFPNYGYRLWKNRIGVKYENKARHCQPVIPGQANVLSQREIAHKGVFLDAPIHHLAAVNSPVKKDNLYRGNEKDYATIAELERGLQVKAIPDYYVAKKAMSSNVKQTEGMNVVFFMSNVTFYSGGRYYLWSCAVSMAMIGVNVHVVTNRMPIFARDFPYPPTLTVSISNKFEVKTDMNFDMVFGTNPDCGKVSLKYAKRNRLPLICFSIETPNYMREYRVGRDTEESYWAEYRKVLFEADYVIALAELPKKRLLEWIPTLTEDRVFVIPPAVNEEALKQVPKLKERNEIAFVSRCVSHKRIDHIIKAMASLPRAYTLNIIGYGNERKIENIARMHGVRTHFYKNINDYEKFRVIRKSRMLLSATSYEGFGISPVEALFCKKPAVVTDLPIFHETLGDHIVYVSQRGVADMANTVLKLLKNTKRRKQLGGRGYEYVHKRYSLKAMRERFKKIFKKIDNRTEIREKEIQILKKVSPKVSVGVIAVNEEEYLSYCLKGIYGWDHCHEIIVVEGAVEKYPSKNVTSEGHSTDKTIEIIQNFRDPEGKIKLVTQNKKWQDKMYQRNQYATRISGDWLFVVDADEFYTEEDLEQLAKEMSIPNVDLLSFSRPEGIIHFWYGLDRQVRGGYWDVPHQRIYRYVPGLKYTDNHNHPYMGNIRTDHITGAKRKTSRITCYHTGFCKKRKNMRDKQDFYYNRGEKQSRSMYSDCREAWFDWVPGKELPHKAQVLPYKGPIPEVLKEHPIYKQGAMYVRG
jgi:glycosyltransferase involved in cell wall biosynthesis